MQEWNIECLDFNEALTKATSDCFIYCDPPYVESFSEYSAEGFNWLDQINLVNKLTLISNLRKIPCVLSNLATSPVIQLYKEHRFFMDIIDVRRSISCKGTGRKKVAEVLATKALQA